MNKIALLFSINYVLISFYFLQNWLRFSRQNPTYNPVDKFLSFLMLVVTTILWPLIVPISCMEIIQARRLEVGNVFPILFTVLLISISFYCSY